MSSYTHTLAVDRPLRDVYDQWTQMEEFPRFMDGVQEVNQVTDVRTHWRVSVAGVEREFDAEIVEQEPDRVMAWRTLDGPQHSGDVRFRPGGPQSTLVTLTMDFEPEGFAENLGDFLGLVEDRVKGDLTRFKQFIESEKLPTGSWRGSVEDGESHDTGAVSADEPAPGPAELSEPPARLAPAEPADRHSPPGYTDLGDTSGTSPSTDPDDSVTDPGTTPGTAGIPAVQDDLGGEDDPSEPMRRSVPTDVPVASLDFGTTAAETAAGESHAERLERENPEPDEPRRP
jgi:ribosome-associated toxin RatA of RatAB toxin-antitoxin module